jgi:hypothetical protein
MNKIEELRREIEALEAQKNAKEQELHQLRGEEPALLDFNTRAQRPAAIMQPEAKIALFLELFGARRDVYPKFWEIPSLGKKGYSPACASNYEAGASGKRYIPLS